MRPRRCVHRHRLHDRGRHLRPAVGSACSFVVFLLVGVAGYRLRSETGASSAIVLVGMAATAVVLGFFAVDTLRNDPETFGAIVAMALLAIVLEVVWKRLRHAGAGPRPRWLTPTLDGAIDQRA